MDGQEPVDTLRELWPASQTMSDGEVRAIAHLIREKDRAIRDLTRARNQGALIVAVLMAAITLLAGSRAVWFWAQVGYTLCAASYAAAVLVIWAYHRRDRTSPDVGLEMRQYYDELLRFHDRQIRFLVSAKYWHLLPLLTGVALIGYGIWIETGDIVMAILTGVVVPIGAWVAFWHLNDVGAVGDLRARRQQVTEWLKEVGITG